MPSPLSQAGEIAAVCAVSARDAWAAGDNYAGAVMLHLNGTAWRQVPVSGAYLNGVAAPC